MSLAPQRPAAVGARSRRVDDGLATAFRRHVAQTSDAPLGLEIARARGSWLYDRAGRRYLDLVAGMGVSNVGHAHPAVLRACAAQLRRHLHVMVYGEFALEPQVRLAARLAELAGPPFETSYFTSSGAEAIEGALKLARKHTGRTRLVAFDLGYHGDTLGALSIGGNPRYRDPFLPLVGPVTLLPWDDATALRRIDARVAAVVIEPVQAEGGVRVPQAAFVRALRARCSEVGALLVFDEVLTGLGRTGALFAFEHFGVRPDVLVLAKALGGGLPLGAFVSSRRIMRTLARRPPLAHVTTFGGSPLACAAGLAALEVIVGRDLAGRAARVGADLHRALVRLQGRHSVIRDVRGRGLLVGIELRSAGGDASVRRRLPRARARPQLDAQSRHGDPPGPAVDDHPPRARIRRRDDGRGARGDDGRHAVAAARRAP